MTDLPEASLFPEGTINFFVPIHETMRIRVTFRIAMEVSTLEFSKETHTEYEGADDLDWHPDMSKNHLPIGIPISSFQLVHKLYDWLGDEDQAQKVASLVEEIDGTTFKVTLPDLLTIPSLAAATA